MGDRNDFDPVFCESINDNVRKSLHQISARAEQVVVPQQWVPLNRNSSALKLFLKRIGRSLAAIGIPVVCLQYVNTSIRMEFEQRPTHACGDAVLASRHPLA